MKGNEGLKLHAYSDIHGFTTVGYGRNLSTRGISKAMAELMLKEDLAYCKVKLDTYYEWWQTLYSGSKIVLQDMCINLGFNGLTKFKKMLGALFRDNYKEASWHLMNSRYGVQLPGRAKRNRDLILGDDK